MNGACASGGTVWHEYNWTKKEKRRIILLPIATIFGLLSEHQSTTSAGRTRRVRELFICRPKTMNEKIYW